MKCREVLLRVSIATMARTRISKWKKNYNNNIYFQRLRTGNSNSLPSHTNLKKLRLPILCPSFPTTISNKVQI